MYIIKLNRTAGDIQLLNPSLHQYNAENIATRASTTDQYNIQPKLACTASNWPVDRRSTFATKAIKQMYSIM